MVSMPYTQATILEVIRHRPVIPVYHRETPPDRTGKFAEYTVPSNSYFLVNVYGMNHDHTVFPDPDVIRPERFLSVDDNGGRTFSGKGQLLPNFGSGKDHQCTEGINQLIVIQSNFKKTKGTPSLPISQTISKDQFIQTPDHHRIR